MTAPFSDPTLTLTLGDALVLVGWWKPLLFLPFFLGWAYLVSTVYDKDAGRWYFKREAWNLGHMGAGLVSILALVLLPLPVFATVPIAIVILFADAGLYLFLRNADDRVPEKFKWTMDYFAQAAERRAAKKDAGQAGQVELKIQGPNGLVAPPQAETQEYAVRVIAESLLQALITHRGSQLDVQPIKENVYHATMLVDGVRQGIRQMPANEASAAIDFLKRCAGLDVEDRRRKQSGEFTYATPEGNLNVIAGVTTLGTNKGMTLGLLVDPAGQVQMRLNDLGMLPKQLEAMRDIVSNGQGIVLLTSPPDQGRTATLYAVLREHDAYTSNVQTLEKDPQSVLEGIRTNEFNAETAEADFHTTLRSILRRDPDVVGVADVPDEATAKEAALCDWERTRVYLSFKSDDPLRAVQLYRRMVDKDKLAAQTLHGVVTQRLMRRLCQTCRVPFQPTPEMLKKLGLPADTKQLFRKGGSVLEKDKEVACPTCGGGGYLGQIGAFAVHPIGDEERPLVVKDDMKALKAMLREKRQLSIQQAALNHVLAGTTTVDEVIRVTESPKKKEPKAKKEEAPATTDA